eukprot:tig00022075_g23664.t1
MTGPPWSSPGAPGPPPAPLETAPPPARRRPASRPPARPRGLAPRGPAAPGDPRRPLRVRALRPAQAAAAAAHAEREALLFGLAAALAASALPAPPRPSPPPPPAALPVLKELVAGLCGRPRSRARRAPAEVPANVRVRCLQLAQEAAAAAARAEPGSRAALGPAAARLLPAACGALAAAAAEQPAAALSPSSPASPSTRRPPRGPPRRPAGAAAPPLHLFFGGARAKAAAAAGSARKGSSRKAASASDKGGRGAAQEECAAEGPSDAALDALLAVIAGAPDALAADPPPCPPPRRAPRRPGPPPSARRGKKEAPASDVAGDVVDFLAAFALRFDGPAGWHARAALLAALAAARPAPALRPRGALWRRRRPLRRPLGLLASPAEAAVPQGGTTSPGRVSVRLDALAALEGAGGWYAALPAARQAAVFGALLTLLGAKPPPSPRRPLPPRRRRRRRCERTPPPSAAKRARRKAEETPDSPASSASGAAAAPSGVALRGAALTLEVLQYKAGEAVAAGGAPGEEAEGPAPEYLKQLCMGSLRECAAGGSAPSEALDVEAVVLCVQGAADPQTRNAALLLLAGLARRRPTASWRTSSPWRPSWAGLPLGGRRGDLRGGDADDRAGRPRAGGARPDGARPLLEAFVSAVPRTAPHRRLPLLSTLLRTLGPPRPAPALLLLLAAAPAPGFDAPEFAAALLLHEGPRAAAAALSTLLHRAGSGKASARKEKEAAAASAPAEAPLVPEYVDPATLGPARCRALALESFKLAARVLGSRPLVGALLEAPADARAAVEASCGRLLEAPSSPSAAPPPSRPPRSPAPRRRPTGRPWRRRPARRSRGPSSCSAGALRLRHGRAPRAQRPRRAGGAGGPHAGGPRGRRGAGGAAPRRLRVLEEDGHPSHAASSERAGNAQAALLAVEQLARRLAGRRPEPFVAAVPRVLAALEGPSEALAASALLTSRRSPWSSGPASCPTSSARTSRTPSPPASPPPPRLGPAGAAGPLGGAPLRRRRPRPARLLLPALAAALPRAAEAGPEGVIRLLEATGACCASMQRLDAAALHRPAFDLILRALELRPSLPAEQAPAVEAAASSAAASLVMKLSEREFRPLFLRALDWASALPAGSSSGSGERADPNRAIAFYGCSAPWRSGSRPSSSPSSGTCGGDGAHFTGEVELVGTPTWRRRQRPSPPRPPSQASPLGQAPPGKEGEAAAPASAAKQAASSAAVDPERLARDEYLVLLPESIPFLAELMEDADAGVEAEVRRAIKLLERCRRVLQRYLSG